MYGLGRFFRLLAAFLVVAPAVIVYRRATDSRATPPHLTDSVANDLRALSVLRTPKSPGSYDHVAALVVEAARLRPSLSDAEARDLLESAVDTSGEGELSPVGWRMAGRLIAWRVNNRQLV